MLISFKAENIFSFKEMEEFSMVPGKARDIKSHLTNIGDMNLLKYSAIFGANASGKSNLIKSMRALQDAIKGNIGIYADSYFKINDYGKNKISVLEIELEIDGKFYAYGFETILNKSTIVKEWLYRLHNDINREVIFSRSEGKTDLYMEGDDLDRANYYAKDADNSGNLFLTEIGSKTIEKTSSIYELSKVYDTLINRLVIIDADSKMMTLDLSNISKMGDILGSFGTGITNIDFEKSDNQSFNVLATNRLKIQLAEEKNKGLNIGHFFNSPLRQMISMSDTGDIESKIVKYVHERTEFDSIEESSGTDRLFDLIPMLFNNRSDMTYIVDELDRSLHPQVTKRFMELFMRYSEGKKWQLIITTHEMRIMDLTFMRRDELWITQKNKEGHSELYSLEDFKERNDRKVDLAYLDGRYGGIPIFYNIFPDISDNNDN